MPGSRNRQAKPQSVTSEDASDRAPSGSRAPFLAGRATISEPYILHAFTAEDGPHSRRNRKKHQSRFYPQHKPERDSPQPPLRHPPGTTPSSACDNISMKVFLFVLMATVLEATGDAVVRVALGSSSPASRILLFAVGATCLTLYGTSLNLAPVEFATVTGLYIATLFVVFQITNFLFFRAVPTPSVLLGGTLIVAGGLIVYIWR